MQCHNTIRQKHKSGQQTKTEGTHQFTVCMLFICFPVVIIITGKQMNSIHTELQLNQTRTMIETNCLRTTNIKHGKYFNLCS